MKVNIFFRNADRMTSVVPENNEKETKSGETLKLSFSELFKNPRVVQLMREAIAQIGDQARQMNLTMTLNRILGLQDQIANVHAKTHDRLYYLMDAVAPQKESIIA